eukprot:tig00000411_g563.t1
MQAGPRIGLMATADGSIASSTLLAPSDFGLTEAQVDAQTRASAVLQPLPGGRQLFLALGRFLARLQVASARAEVLGLAPADPVLERALPISYITGGLVSGVRISVLSARSRRAVRSYVVNSPAGLASSRRTTSISLSSPHFAVGGRYVVQACAIDEDVSTGCGTSKYEFTVEDRFGSTASRSKSMLLQVLSNDGQFGLSGRLRANIDGVPVERPLRGKGFRTSAVSTADSTLQPSPFDQVATANIRWNDPAIKKGAAGPARALQLQAGRIAETGRWSLFKIAVADVTGEMVEWALSSELGTNPVSAAAGERLECGRLNLTLYTAGKSEARGWLILSQFRLWAFGSGSTVRDTGCEAGQACLLSQADAGRPAVSLSCAPAEETTVLIRADLTTNSVTAVLDQVSAASGTQATLSTARRRLAQSGGQSLLTASLGSGPASGTAASTLAEAVDSGSQSVSLVQGLALVDMEEISNPGAQPAGYWTSVAASDGHYDALCSFGATLFAVSSAIDAASLRVRSFSLNRGAWTNGPSSTTGAAQAAFACLEPVIYAFGGLSNGAATSTLLAYSTTASAWSVVTPSTDLAPPARSAATLAAVGDATLLLYGGADAAGNALSDVWFFDIASSSWYASSDPSPLVPGRYGAASAVVGTVVYVFGGVGTGGAAFFSDLLEIEIESGTSQLLDMTSASAPSARAFAVMHASDAGDRLFVAGGYGAAASPVVAGELFIYDVGAEVWSKVAPVGSAAAFPARTAAPLLWGVGSTVYAGNLYALGTASLVGWGPDPLPTLSGSGATAASLPPQVLYPTSTSLVVVGGTYSISWASNPATYTSAEVTAFPVDRSRTQSVYFGFNNGAASFPVSATAVPGLYQVSVRLTGPSVTRPLVLLSDPFRVLSVEDAINSLSVGVTLLSPTAVSEVILGDSLPVTWATRGLALQQEVTVTLVSATSQANLQTLTTSTTSTVGSVTWKADNAAPGRYFFRVQCATAAGVTSADSAEFFIRPYAVTVAGPQYNSNWFQGNIYQLSIFTSNPAPGESLATISLLSFPDLTVLRTIAPSVKLSQKTTNGTSTGRRLLENTGDFIWNISRTLPTGIYVVQAEVPADAAAGKTVAFCIGGNCQPGIVFQSPSATSEDIATLFVGSPFLIRWISAGVPTDARVQISIANFATGTRIPIAVRENTGSFQYIPPPALGAGIFFFEISASVDGNPIRGTSTRFLIESPAAYLLVRLPDGRQSFSTGQRVTLRWDLANVAALTCGIRLIRSDGVISSIATRAPNTGSYVWAVPTDVATGRYIVEIGVADFRISSVSAQFAVTATGAPSVTVEKIPNVQTGQAYTIRWTTVSLPRSVEATVAILSSSGTVLRTFAASNELQTAQWTVGEAGTYRVNVTVEGVSGTSDPFAVATPTQPDPCLGKPPTAVAAVSETTSKIGPAKEITLESGRGSALLSAEGSLTCDGKPVSGFTWVEVELSDPKRPAVLASDSAQQTDVRRLRVGRSVFRLTVTDRLGQTATTEVAVTMLHRKLVTATICVEGADAFAFAATFNASTVLEPLAAAFGRHLSQTLSPASLGGVRAAACPTGGGPAVSAQIPAIPGLTGTEVAEKLAGMTPASFPSSTLSGLRRHALAALPVRSVSFAPAEASVNAPPNLPTLTIIPASRYSYIIVDPKTKIGKSDIVAAAFDPAPGIVSSYEWYVDGVLQASTTDSLSLSLKVGTYAIRAIALDDENSYSESDTLTLFVVDEYTCNVAKDLVILLDASTSSAAYGVITSSFLQKLLRPFWLQGPESYAWIVRYGLPPAGNASVVIERAEVKTACDAIVSKRLPSETYPSQPRLLARGLDAGRLAVEATRRTGIVRSMLVVSFDEPLDAGEARNASILARRRNNVYAVPSVADGYAFEGGFDFFREIVTQPNTTTMLPVTLELQEEVEKAAINIAQAICEGKAPPGADDTDVGEAIGRAITVAVAVAVASGVASSIGSSVGASMGGSIGGGAGGASGGGAFGIINQAQFISETSFLSMPLPGTYNSTSTSTQWTMFYFGGFGQQGSGGGNKQRGRHLLGINSFSRELGGEIGAPFLQESLFWTAVIFIGVTVLQVLAYLLCRYVFKFKETPKVLWFPKPQITVLIIAYEVRAP